MAMTGDPNEAVLAAGLRWLLDTEQPEDAVIIHHGENMAGEGNRRFSFFPAGWDGRAIIAVGVARVEWIAINDKDRGYDKAPANPLEPDELERLSATITALGEAVVSTWNGYPATTGSLALARPAHPSLRAAVQRYKAGCPEHPDNYVFCECGWYRQGYAQLIRPALTESRS